MSLSVPGTNGTAGCSISAPGRHSITSGTKRLSPVKSRSQLIFENKNCRKNQRGPWQVCREGLLVVTF